MPWWPIYGLRKMLTERRHPDALVKMVTAPATTRPFRHSLFVFVMDAGCSNALAFELTALESPQYNIHRFGIYLTDSPRHADILLLLGRPTRMMLVPLQETIAQLPQPFCIVTIDDNPGDAMLEPYPSLPNHVCALEGIPAPKELLDLFIDLAIPKQKRP